jgi:hypothetical protein
LKADKVKTLKRDDATLTVPDSGITANAVRELDDAAKTGPVRRREAREARLADEAEAYEEQHEVSTVQQAGPAADIAESQAAERQGE